MATTTEETTKPAAPAKGGVKVTDKALAKVRSAIVKEGISPEQGGLRLGVQGGGCSGSELQHSFRYPAPRARPYLPVRRCARVCRSEIVHLSERHGPGLSGDFDAAGIRVRQSECIEVVRLRHIILRVRWLVFVWRGRPRPRKPGAARPSALRSNFSGPRLESLRIFAVHAPVAGEGARATQTHQT